MANLKSYRNFLRMPGVGVEPTLACATGILSPTPGASPPYTIRDNRYKRYALQGFSDNLFSRSWTMVVRGKGDNRGTLGAWQRTGGRPAAQPPRRRRPTTSRPGARKVRTTEAVAAGKGRPTKNSPCIA